MFWCPSIGRLSQQSPPILWFWSMANVPTQERDHIEGSVYIGSASICAPTSSIFFCPYSVSRPRSLSLSSPLPLIFLYFLFLCLSASFPLLPLLLHHCLVSASLSLSLFLFFFEKILPSSCPPRLRSPPLHPSVSTRQRVIHLHWGDTCAVLTERALTE